MSTVDRTLNDRTAGPGASGRVTSDLAGGLLLAVVTVAGTWWLLDLPASYVALGVGLQGVLTGLILWIRPDRLPGPGLGAANRVTLGRAALAMPVLALALGPGQLGPGGHWWVIVVSTAVLVLDGVDGRVARRTGTQTSFGARFDMELDAALIMALSLLVWRSGRVGAWVLLIGLMRYAFGAAGRFQPALAAELPPSRRRKVVCVVQGVVLLVALGPIIPAWGAVTASAAGLAALTYSFAVDTRWALREEKGRRRE